MNRLSWDSTAPRRPTAKRATRSRPDELGLLDENAELVRVPWARLHRPSY
jgi:hypothetical protein